MLKRNNVHEYVIIVLLLATAFRLYQIQTQSIWFDEGWSAYSAIQPDLQAAIDSDKTNPPLYYVIVNIAARGFGDSEFALRWISLAFGLVGIALAYQLGKKLFNANAGLMAAFLTAFSPLLWWAAQEARMYTLLALLVTLCALAWHNLIPRNSDPHPPSPSPLHGRGGCFISIQKIIPTWLALVADVVALGIGTALRPQHRPCGRPLAQCRYNFGMAHQLYSSSTPDCFSSQYSALSTQHCYTLVCRTNRGWGVVVTLFR